MQILSRVAVGLAAVTLLAGCTKSATTTTNTSTTANVPTQSTETSGSTAVGDNNVTVSLSEYSFTPNSITLKAGATSTITLENKGTLEHTFTVSGLGINMTVPAGGAEVVTVDAPAAGTYTVICTMPGHEALGMKGTITVQ